MTLLGCSVRLDLASDGYHSSDWHGLWAPWQIFSRFGVSAAAQRTWSQPCVFRSNYRFPGKTTLAPHSSESEAILASQYLA